MQRDKGLRDTVSMWLRGRPDCFVMPDCLAGRHGGTGQRASFLLAAPPTRTLQGTRGRREVHDTSGSARAAGGEMTRKKFAGTSL